MPFGWGGSPRPMGDLKRYPHSSNPLPCLEDTFFLNLKASGVWVVGSVEMGAAGSPLFSGSKTGPAPPTPPRVLFLTHCCSWGGKEDRKSSAVLPALGGMQWRGAHGPGTCAHSVSEPGGADCSWAFSQSAPSRPPPRGCGEGRASPRLPGRGESRRPRAGRAGKDLESRRNLEKPPCSCWSLPGGSPASWNVLGVEAPQEAPPHGSPAPPPQGPGVQHRQDPV